MDFVSPLLELVKDLWGLASKPLGYIRNLKDNVRSLDKTNENLKAVREDVEARVEREEADGRRRTKQVVNWLGEVQKFVGGAGQVLREAGEHDRIKCLGRCLPWSSRSSYKLGKRVDQKLNEARELQTEGEKFVVLTLPLPPPPVLEMPMDETVGLDISKVKKVWKLLVDEKQVGVIGLYGTGGVGKTTLMKRINEELARANHGFIVIWVVVSRQVNEERIQDTIRKRLDIKDEHWNGWSWNERVHQLGKSLNKRKFVLLLDDLWGRLDLSKIGVPPLALKNGSKVIFTTRSQQVCNQMGAHKAFEVQCLTPDKALELFENNVGKSTVDSDPEIQKLAKDIAKECKGLPLALITVGRAMAGRKNPPEWKFALTILRSNPHRLSGMVEEVYHILEFSYYSLNDSTFQHCFLYCCLFPEDYPIRPHNLIELWNGEGLLGDTDDVYGLRDKGEYVLGTLKLACLLESGCDSKGEYVKMHDVIRDMATWIARDRGQKENKLLVIENEEDMSGEMISKWGEAKKVSLWGKWIHNIDRTPPQCSKVETLFIRETSMMVMPRGFFHSMAACLMLLDLSNNSKIKLLPEGICDMINLRYLNLLGTRIRKLPWEIKNLTRLQWLLLDDIYEKVLIPTGAIASLPLNVFSLWSSDSFADTPYLVNEEEIVEELGHMQHLIDLSIRMVKSSSILKIFKSLNIRKCIRRVCFYDSQNDLTSITINYSPASGGGFLHLEVLHLIRCWLLREMEITQGIGQAPINSCFPNLVDVFLCGCGLPDLSWLVHAPKLRKLRVEQCPSMERIIGDGVTREELADSGLFSRLEQLALVGLPKLTSICDHALSFPHGVSFRIGGCPGLRKLPLDRNDARGRGFSIAGHKDWWAKFEWNPADRVTLQQLDGSHAEEMAFREAVRKMKHWEGIAWARIGFGPSGSGPTE